jgi:hypothetical protein
VALDLKTELDGLIAALQANAVELAICGGVAVTIHGAPRLTDDFDFLVPADHIAAAKTAAATVGFDIPAGPITSGSGSAAQRTVHRVSKPDGPGLLTLDLIVAGGFLDEVWRDKVLVEWDAHRVHVVSRAGLIAMKRVAGRPKDLVDIAALEADGDDA